MLKWLKSLVNGTNETPVNVNVALKESMKRKCMSLRREIR